jgi:hypothetical protein
VIRRVAQVVGGNVRAAFCQSVALVRLNAAWDAARQLKSRPLWLALSGKAMEVLNVAMALKVYRQLGDAGMVMALEQLLDIEDKNLLAGHIAMLFADYAQVRAGPAVACACDAGACRRPGCVRACAAEL